MTKMWYINNEKWEKTEGIELPIKNILEHLEGRKTTPIWNLGGRSFRKIRKEYLKRIRNLPENIVYSCNIMKWITVRQSIFLDNQDHSDNE